MRGEDMELYIEKECEHWVTQIGVCGLAVSFIHCENIATIFSFSEPQFCLVKWVRSQILYNPLNYGNTLRVGLSV